MICPKCRGHLRTVDRAGVHLEQCENCRGIFLDHGELEQILGAEQRYYGGAPPGAYRDSPRPHGGHRDSPRPYVGSHGGGYRDSPRPYGGGHRDSSRPYGGGHGHRRKGGFLGELFG